MYKAIKPQLDEDDIEDKELIVKLRRLERVILLCYFLIFIFHLITIHILHPNLEEQVISHQTIPMFILQHQIL